MSTWRNVRTVYGAALVLAGLCLGLNASGAEEAQKEQQKKGKIVEIDLSKLPPELAKRLEELSRAGKEEGQKGKKGPPKGFEKFGKKDFFQKKGFKKGAEEKKPAEGKTLTLAQAIAVVEKLSKGEAIKAERRGEGSKAHFSIEIADSLGNRRVELSSTGEVLKGHETGSSGRGGFMRRGFFNKGEFKQEDFKKMWEGGGKMKGKKGFEKE